MYFTPKEVDGNETKKVWGGGAYIWQAAIEQGFGREMSSPQQEKHFQLLLHVGGTGSTSSQWPPISGLCLLKKKASNLCLHLDYR